MPFWEILSVRREIKYRKKAVPEFTVREMQEKIQFLIR